MIVYFNGRYLPQEDVHISPDDRGFVFADGVYEVIRAYHGVLFHADLHFARLQRSLSEIGIPEADVPTLEAACYGLLERNGLLDTDARFYLQITRGVARRTHVFPDPPPDPTVYITAGAITPPEKEWETGIKVILVPDIRWARCDIKSLMLLPNILASQQAKEAGAWEAIFVRDGVVTEGSHTTVCGIFDGTLFTAPVTNNILGGVTREIVLSACRRLSIPIKEFPIFEATLPRAQELMILGTTTEVMPVVQVDDLIIGDGAPGPLTRKLQRAFRETVREETTQARMWRRGNHAAL
ncbi:MAG: aminotransferase class IV [Anaerolineae bacterium]|nr:aminotransferase class IV [Anaerolineae bacterium]